jgi:hypothetical protein
MPLGRPWRKDLIDAEVAKDRHCHTFFILHCQGPAAMKAKNRVAYETAEAEAAGYRKAADCR